METHLVVLHLLEAHLDNSFSPLRTNKFNKGNRLSKFPIHSNQRKQIMLKEKQKIIIWIEN